MQRISIAPLLAVSCLVSACSQAPSEPYSSGKEHYLERLANALDSSDALARAAQLAEALGNLGPEAIDEARRIVLSHHEGALAEQALLVSWWASYQPEDAFAWARNQSDVEIKAGTMIAAMREWAVLDPKGAATTVENMSSPLKTACRRALIRGWYAAGGNGLLGYVRDLEMGPERQGAIQAYAHAVAAHDGIDALMRWADSIDDEIPRFQRAVLRHTGWVLGDVAPHRAAEWAERKDDAGVREMVAASWARADGLASLRWSLGLPHDGSYETHPMRMALRHWIVTDREAAVAWLLEQNPAESQQLAPAAGAIAMVVARRAPERALTWATLIPDEEKRRNAYGSLLTRWAKHDRAAMQAWLAHDRTLPEGMRNRFLGRPTQDEEDSKAAADS